MQDWFEKYHADNPHLFFLFERYTFQALSAGAKALSARLIVERIRWECIVNTKAVGDPYKVNDHVVPYYSRMFMDKYPEYLGVFKTRVKRA